MLENVIKRIKEHRFLLFILLIFLILKLIQAFKYHFVIWDEAVYMGIGKYIWSSGNAGIWEVIRPIGLPLILGLIWKIGLNLVFFSELLIILFSIGCLVLVYLISYKLFNKKIAILSSILMATTPFFFYYSSFIFTGIPSCFFVLLSIYYYIKNRLFFAGLLASLAFIFRFPNGLLLFIFFILILFKKESIFAKIKDYLKFGAGFSIFVIPFLASNYLMYKYTAPNLYYAIFRPLIFGALHQGNIVHSILDRGALYNFLYYPINIFLQNPISIFSILGIFLYFKQKKYSLNVLFSPLIIYLLYFSYIANKQIRFFLVFLPFFIIFSSYGIYFLLKQTYKMKKKNLFYISVIILLISSLVPLNIIYKQYLWRVDEPDNITEEYHKFFLNNNLSGTILTTNPTAATFTDLKFIQFYTDVDMALSTYIITKDDVDYIMFTEDFYACFDDICKNKKDFLLYLLKSENKIIFNRSYNNLSYIIFERFT